MLTVYIITFVSAWFYLWTPGASSSRNPRALGELVFTIKGFDNCTDEGKGLFKWENTKMKFGKNSKAIFSGNLLVGFPISDDGTTVVKMTTYTWQNGGWKMLFKSDTKSIFALLDRLSPATLQGILKCLNLKNHYLPPGDYLCNEWHMDPFKKALPVSIKTKAYINIDFYRHNQKMGCTKVLVDVS